MATSENSPYASGTYTKGEGDSKQTRHVTSRADAVSAVYDGFVRQDDLPQEVQDAVGDESDQSGWFTDKPNESEDAAGA